jgi:hypothetical protein
LTGIAIPGSVEIIEDDAFKECPELEYCLLDEDASLVRIGRAAFAECLSLRFFHIPSRVESIGQNCFKDCSALSRLRFYCGNSLKELVGGVTLDTALTNFGFDAISSIFILEVTETGTYLDFPGWSSVFDEDSHLTLIQPLA